MNNNALINALQGYDTPTVCNAIELFKVRPQTNGYLDSRIRACFPNMPPMVGYATTATFCGSKPSKGRPLYESLEAQVSAFDQFPGPVVVVFQDLDTPSRAATFGEVMCKTYKTFGAAGLLTSGTGRDLQQVEAIGFPVFTSGEICSHGYPSIIDINVPVEVGGVNIKPGDLLHGDCNGVTTIPIEIANELPQACKQIIEAESEVLNYLDHANPPTPTGLGKHFANTAKAIHQVSK